ncbi:hypothetical protein BJP27_02405 [Pseudomonas oryzihabitans]|nr:hypothetical protein BJP27_02405 [Pseudomonas psychrotolerans]
MMVFATTLLVLIYMCDQIKERSNLVTITNFRMLADERMSRVKNRLQSEARRIEGAKRFIENSDITTQAEFKGFITPFLYPGGAYLFVRDLNEHDYKTAGLTKNGLNDPGFDYRHYLSDKLGETPRQDGDPRLTILYSASQQPDMRPGVSLDTLDPALPYFFEKAKNASQPVVSAPIKLNNGKFGFFFITAIGCKNAICPKDTAFVAAMVPIAELMEADLPASSTGQMAINLYFIDPNNKYISIYTNDVQATQQVDFTQSRNLLPDDTRYGMTISASDNFVLAQGEDFKISYLIALSIIVSSLLAMMFFVLANQNRKTAYLVLKRTHEMDLMTRTDSLTGAYNRRHFIEEMRHHTESIRPILIKHGLIALDIDKFKSINDGFGHNKGDEVLSELVRIVSENLRKKDVFCRNGGEEFFIICPDTNVAGCFIVAEKLRQCVESHAFPIERQVTVSFGITEFSYGESITTITERADRALYRAKVAGRNRIEIEGEV